MAPSTTPPRPCAPSPRPLRWRAGLAVLALVLLLHGWTAAGLGAQAREARPPAPPAPALQLRRVVLVAPPPVVADPAPPPRPATAVAPARPSGMPAARPGAAEPAPAPPAHAVRAAATRAPAAAEPAADADGADGHDGPAAPGPGGTAPPLYATRLPPPAELHFLLQRGAIAGRARLRWQPQGGHYDLHFDAELAFGLPLMRQRSQGALDPHGLAPERFSDRRGRRGAQAAHFQRAEGRITFSGAGVEYPAWPGAQDRLSWIVQLAAILAAAPEPPRAVSMFVVSARGGAGVWTFLNEGRDTLDTPDGPVPALRLRREPERDDDLRVDIWLDPARHHWPLRIRMAPVRGGEPLELHLDPHPGARAGPPDTGP